MRLRCPACPGRSPGDDLDRAGAPATDRAEQYRAALRVPVQVGGDLGDRQTHLGNPPHGQTQPLGQVSRTPAHVALASFTASHSTSSRSSPVTGSARRHRAHLTTETVVPLTSVVRSNSSTSRRARPDPPRPLPELKPSVIAAPRRRSRSGVGEDGANAPPAVVLDRLDGDGPGPTVHERVAGELTGRGDHLGLLHQRQLAPMASDRTSWRTRTTSSELWIGSTPAEPEVITNRHPRRVATGVEPVERLSLIVVAGQAALSGEPAQDRQTLLQVQSRADAVEGEKSSTRVMATASRMPTTTVSASSTRESAAVVANNLPMNESTISTAEMSIATPRAPVAHEPFGQNLLQSQHEWSCRST